MTKKRGPCQGCQDRTITCHGVCRRYQDWKEQHEAEKQWLQSQKPIPSIRLIEGHWKFVRSRARGYNTKRGNNNNE